MGLLENPSSPPWPPQPSALWDAASCLVHILGHGGSSVQIISGGLLGLICFL